MDTNHYRNRLYNTYRETHARHVDVDGQEKLDWFLKYITANYLKHLTSYDRELAKILDIGCNQGHLLAAFSAKGFKHLYGIDLSPVDIEQANVVVPTAKVACIDAFEYLRDKDSYFDIITIKAVLEHIPKDGVIPMLEAINTALKPNGVVLVDVPNMDWLFAQHERYMDFTHEVGFTRESLGQVLRNAFPTANVYSGVALSHDSLKHRIAWKFRPLFIRLINYLFSMVGEGANDVWWYSRSIIGVAQKA